jgi:glutamate-1-semialdehyde 2,1-aminomutase
MSDTPLSADHASLVERARQIVARESEVYRSRTAASQRATERAKQVLPMGVPSSFQYYDPHPVVAARAQGAWLEDVDGNRYVDFNMGYGALLAGHGHPAVVKAVTDQAVNGTLFVTPCEANAEVAELLAERFGLPRWRFTNSGTEATMDALRVAKAVTGRDKIVKVEGGYHGHHDEVMISMKPPLAEAGPADQPRAIPATEGITRAILNDTLVVPYNQPEALERVLAGEEIAAFIVEPAMENIGIVLPDDGYLAAVREITRRHGTLLVFDEVKTGITAGYGGATRHFGVQPDIVCLAKSIGGGLPIGAFGGTAEAMDRIGDGRVLHLGTYNGTPLVMAATKAVLAEACTREAVDAAIAMNAAVLATLAETIAEFELPAHTVQLGAKGCVTWATSRVRNYRDYKATDFDLAFANWLHGINHGVLLPPGLDEQWLISVQHTAADAAVLTDSFRDFAHQLRS